MLKMKSQEQQKLLSARNQMLISMKSPFELNPFMRAVQGEAYESFRSI